jgi:hypothetical protein
MPDDDVVSGVLSITGGAGGIGAAVAVAVNREGTMFGLHAALPALAANGGGAVVVTASLAGLGPAAFDPVHSATGVTGEAWTVQAGAPPAPVVFPAIHMPRTV